MSSSFLSDLETSSHFMMSFKPSSTVIEEDVTLVPVNKSATSRSMKQLNEISVDRTFNVDTTVKRKTSSSLRKLDTETVELIDLFNNNARKSNTKKQLFQDSPILQEHKSTNNRDQCTSSKAKLYNLVVKQQDIVKKLNQENQQVIRENCQLKQQLQLHQNQTRVEILKATSDLTDQNKALKEQLLVSQSYSLRTLKELRSAKKEIHTLNEKLKKI